MKDSIWKFRRGDGPLVASAIHDGHRVRDEVRPLLALTEAARLREEDPFTGPWTEVAPHQVVGLHSRFEVDLNRPPEKAVYRTPEDAWGLEVWQGELPDEIAERSLEEHRAFYAALRSFYAELSERHGSFIVLDLHTYNHRREGAEGPIADPEANPQVNIGTGTLRAEEKFRPLIDRFIANLRAFEFPGGALDVRENVKFRGGYHALSTHEAFPEQSCVIAVEFKKFFMDEWTGAPDRDQLKAIYRALASTVPGILEEHGRL